MFHNTSLRARQAFFSYAEPPVHNLVTRNNLFLGRGKWAWEARNDHPGADMDYDGFSEGKLRINGNLYENVAVMRGKGGLEDHGVQVDLTIFAELVKYPRYKKAHKEHPDLRLRNTSTWPSWSILPNRSRSSRDGRP